MDATVDYTNAGFTIGNVENLSIKLLGDASNEVTLSGINDAQLRTITIAAANTGKDVDGTALASDDLKISGASLSSLIEKIDASAATGKVDVSGLASHFIATGATLIGGSGNDTFTGGIGADQINGGKGNDTLSGGDANDVISGDEGDDQLFGDGGNDTLDGGEGNDILRGGAGDDELTGWNGKDTFVFEADAAANGTDTITEFTAGEGISADVLDFTEFFGTALLPVSAQTSAAELALTASSTNTVMQTGHVYVMKLDAAITDKDYAGANFAELFSTGTGKFSTTFTDGGKAVVLVQGSDVTKAYMVSESLTDGVLTPDVNIAGGEVSLVGVISTVGTYHESNFA